MINRLRALLKRKGIDPQPIEMEDVIAEVVSLVRADALARQVKLEFSADAGLPPVLGDRVHLQQVLLNLILNGIDALNEIEPDRRCIEIHASQAGDGNVEVSVRDNGHGVPEPHLERLFEPFFTTKDHGMGMGLPVSLTIIEAHKGRLWAENRPEGGAVFRFTAPPAGDGGNP